MREEYQKGLPPCERFVREIGQEDGWRFGVQEVCGGDRGRDDKMIASYSLEKILDKQVFSAIL
jgi:hypothetical protein